MFYRIIIFICTLSLLTGCVSALKAPPAAAPTSTTKPASWETRAALLERIHTWDAKGSVSIQHQGKTDIASLVWRQRNEKFYNLTLTGPLSMGRVEITGKPKHITFQQGDKLASASSPEALLAEQLGWKMPVSNLYYWLRGLPVKGPVSQMQFNQAGQISHLAQQGWSVRYLEYMDVNGVSLPRKMDLHNPELQVRLVVRQWILES